MKIVYIAPGVGDTFYCQNCVRNMDLIHAMQKKGHQPIIIPMYLPINILMPDETKAPIFFGAISVYLTQKISVLKYLPQWIKKILDNKFILKWISKISHSTEPKGHEELTISILKGTEGKHKQELQRLIHWLKDEIKPDAVHLANALLIGIGVAIKKELKTSVFCTLQDENEWIDKMNPEYANQAWQIIEEGSHIIDSFISVSDFYKSFVCQKTQIKEDRIKTVPMGIDLKRYTPNKPNFNHLTIGFLSRISDLLGIDILIQAFIILKKQKKYQHLKLLITGGMTKTDKFALQNIKTLLEKTNISQDVKIISPFNQKNLDSFFKELTVLCVPTPQGEAFGLFIIESLASGIPVIEPALGGYPEIIKKTNGGIIYQENTPENIAEEIAKLLDNFEKILDLSEQGLNGIKKYYDINITTDKLIDIYQQYNQ